MPRSRAAARRAAAAPREGTRSGAVAARHATATKENQVQTSKLAVPRASQRGVRRARRAHATRLPCARRRGAARRSAGASAQNAPKRAETPQGPLSVRRCRSMRVPRHAIGASCAAQIAAVHARRTSSLASLFAPRSSKRRTTSSSPLSAALYSGVAPLCARREGRAAHRRHRAAPTHTNARMREAHARSAAERLAAPRGDAARRRGAARRGAGACAKQAPTAPPQGPTVGALPPPLPPDMRPSPRHVALGARVAASVRARRTSVFASLSAPRSSRRRTTSKSP